MEEGAARFSPDRRYMLLAGFRSEIYHSLNIFLNVKRVPCARFFYCSFL